MSAGLTYRTDIDGLRAVAVLAVVLFHLGGTPVTGGFVGVDIFFVISGYLITSIIVRELKSKSFSLGHFYERRILRIFPALFAMFAVTAIISALVLFPKDFKYFGETLSASAAFGSNFTFWKESGYFKADSFTIPILHTWSLAVEEQFYIFFPLFLIGVHKFFPKYLRGFVVAGFILSFLLAMPAELMGSTAVLFYLLPTRAWELLTGSLLALSVLPAIRQKQAADFFAIAGFALIYYAVFGFSEETVFPGANALFPTIGAAFLIVSGQAGQGISCKILGNRIAVFFGKISYSLYLWHWPLIVFVKYASPIQLSGIASLSLFIVCVGVSYLSWRFIEQPARQQQRFSRRKIFILAFIGSVIVAATGLFISDKDGFPKRFPEEIQKIDSVSIGKTLPQISNPPNAKGQGYNGILGDPEAAPSFLVWGDSHAQASTPGIDLAAKEAGKKGYFLGLHSCFAATQDVKDEIGDCNDFNRRVFVFLRQHKEIKTVILIGHWSMHEKRFAKEARLGRTPPDLMRDLLDTLLTQLEEEDRHTVFMIDMPHAPVENVPLFMARARHFGADPDLKSNLANFKKREEGMDLILGYLKARHNFKIVNPSEVFCPNGICSISHNGQPLFQDNNHISTYGSEVFKDIYKPFFEE